MLAVQVFGLTRQGHTITEAVRVELLVVRRRTQDCHRTGLQHAPARPDLDNHVKAVLDAMQKASVLLDDALVVELEARKCYAEQGGSPRVEVTLTSPRELACAKA